LFGQAVRREGQGTTSEKEFIVRVESFIKGYHGNNGGIGGDSMENDPVRRENLILE